MSPQMILGRAIPATRWLPAYKLGDLRGDAAAGVTTAVMLVPQAMAYALLAGLPPVVGLYSALAPLVIYALLGTSRELAVGPVAMSSLLVGAALGPLAHAGSPHYVALAVGLSAMVGLVRLGMGVARLGFLTNFISRPVLSGFTSAAALIIAASQLKHLLGISLPQSENIFTLLAALPAHLHELRPATPLLAAASVAALVLLRRWNPRFPAALAVAVAATLAVLGLGLEAHGVAVVGQVPAGLPGFAVPDFRAEGLGQLWGAAATISLVGFMESISASKSIARRKGYDIEPNQELIALGAASLVGSLFGAYPINGGLSRTAVNAQAGARTPLAGLLTAGVVALSLLFFTPALRAMPKAALAAIIVAAVAGMIDVAEVKRLWKLSRAELVLLALTFAATLGLGISVGISAGVGASLLWFVVRSTHPHYAVLGRLPNTSVFRNVKNFPEACVWPGLLIVRMDAKLYFGNVSFLKETLAALEAQSPSPLRAVILDAASINDLDSSADAALHELLDGYQKRGVTLSFAQLKGPVREVMRRSGLYDRLGADRAFFTLEDAVQEATQRLGLPQPDGCRPAPLSEADYAAQTHRPCLSHHKG